MGLKVAQVMTRPVIATTRQASVQDVTAQLVRGGMSGLPVADRDGKVVGIVTEHDIVEAVLGGKRLGDIRAEDIMQTDPVTVDLDADLEEALQLFKAHRIVRVPVTEKGKLVGILARTDALRGILEEPEFLVF